MAFPAYVRDVWQFEELTGEPADPVRGHDLSVGSGSPTLGATGKHGFCVSFDGVNDAYELAYHSDFALGLNQEWTFTCWVKIDSLQGDALTGPVIAAKGAVDGFGDTQWTLFTNLGNISLVLKDADGDRSVFAASVSMTPGIWYFVAWGCKSDGIPFIKVNCTPRVNAVGLLWTYQSTGSFYVGGGRENDGDWAADRFLAGDLDELYYWDRALTDDELGELCQGDPGSAHVASVSFYNAGGTALSYTCGQVRYGDYIFPETFYPAEDPLSWLVPMQKIPRAHGGRAQTGYLNPKRITIAGGVLGPGAPLGGQDSLRDTLDDIRNALASQPQNLYVYDDRYWRNARAVDFGNGYDPTWFCRIAGRIQIIFETDDPFEYSTTINSNTWLSPVEGETRTITAGGNALAYPTFTITTSGTSIDLTITNTTTGESFRLNGTVASPSTIVVDCLDQTVTISGEDEIDLFDGQWIRLDVGANVMQVEDVTSGSITSIVTTFRNRYW